jgi:hypothetical protein
LIADWERKPKKRETMDDRCAWMMDDVRQEVRSCRAAALSKPLTLFARMTIELRIEKEGERTEG